MSVQLEAGEVGWCWVHDQHTLRRLNFKKRVHQHQRMLKERNQLNVDSFIHSLLAAAPFDKIEYGLALKWKGGFIEKENKFEFKWCITYEMENLCWKLLFIGIHFLFFSFLMVLFCGKNLSFKFLQRIRGKTHRTRGFLYFSFNGKLYSMGFSFGWLLHTSQMMKLN